MHQSSDPLVTGQKLVADYQSVLLSQATAQAAVHEAERSESELLQQLSAASRGAYLSGSALNEIDGNYVARESVDAHIKKVQAEQLQSMTGAQISAMIAEDQANYKRHRVRITMLESEFQPFDAVWFDKRTGYRTSAYKKRAIEGEIQELGLEKNILMIKPKRLMRLLNNSLELYVVYVINPTTMMPAVEISLL